MLNWDLDQVIFASVSDQLRRNFNSFVSGSGVPLLSRVGRGVEIGGLSWVRGNVWLRGGAE